MTTKTNQEILATDSPKQDSFHSPDAIRPDEEGYSQKQEERIRRARPENPFHEVNIQ